MDAFGDFASFDLRDATIVDLRVDWSAGICELRLRGAIRPGAHGGVIRWARITGLAITRAMPWGPSESILEWKRTDETDEIVVQSGDSIRVTAPTRHVQIS